MNDCKGVSEKDKLSQVLPGMDTRLEGFRLKIRIDFSKIPAGIAFAESP